ncbi:MAG: TerB family tellurite resistance protein [Alphaproteobacteria bacterium]
MINRVRNLFRLNDGGAALPEITADGLSLAAAALLVEAAMLDGHFHAREQAGMRQALAGRFGLNDEETDSLMEAANEAVRQSHDLHRFTRVIKDKLGPAERVRIIEMLWEVVYADGVLHEYESNLLRRVAGLIYVSDRDSGAARMRVLKRLGGSGPLLGQIDS